MSPSRNERAARLPDGASLAYTRIGPPGDGPPILLNRPLGGSMALWGEFATRLSTEREVVSFDPRGVGRSSDLPLLHTTRDMARDAIGLLDALDIPRAHVFGLSLGGMVASWIAVDAPDRVARLILASTLPEPSAISHRIVRHAYPMLRCLARPGVEAELCLIRQILSPEFRDGHPARMRAIIAAIRAAPATRANLIGLGLAAARHDGESALRGLPVETLLLFGDLDPIAGRTSQAELSRDLPNSRLEVLAGAGHDLSIEQPIATAESVIRFLRGDSPPA